ncbi:Hypothetical predicted protein [Octopus vulgaris]|uniref:Uncharacterized protein n=1 Tax=Octopus vulgaris TaxID=6645 RepID=A0AA36FMI9_OCTVU|nr:Hypothetical predicted protein [Octopus vulgaris]
MRRYQLSIIVFSQKTHYCEKDIGLVEVSSRPLIYEADIKPLEIESHEKKRHLVKYINDPPLHQRLCKFVFVYETILVNVVIVAVIVVVVVVGGGVGGGGGVAVLAVVRVGVKLARGMVSCKTVRTNMLI